MQTDGEIKNPPNELHGSISKQFQARSLCLSCQSWRVRHYRTVICGCLQRLKQPIASRPTIVKYCQTFKACIANEPSEHNSLTLTIIPFHFQPVTCVHGCVGESGRSLLPHSCVAVGDGGRAYKGNWKIKKQNGSNVQSM